jgi:hypothetical protein
MATIRPNTNQPFEITFHQRPKGEAGKYTVDKLTELLREFCEKMKRRAPIRSAEVYMKEPHNPVGKAKTHEVMLHVHLWTGKRYMASSEDYVSRAKHVGLEAQARAAMKEIAEQIRRDHVR